VPVGTAILETHISRDDPFFPIASLRPEDAQKAIRKAWERIEHPVLRKIADGVLGLPPTILSTSTDRSYLGLPRWAGSGSSFWIAGLEMMIPESLRRCFPLHRFDPLEEFLRFFGGLRDSPFIDYAGDFLDPRDSYIISANDPRRYYGNVGDWEGALPFYNGGTGDMIVLAPDGRVGAFLHEYAADESESPFGELDYSFPELLSHYADYIRLPEESPEREESCFYY
jgi:hypothetical protein